MFFSTGATYKQKFLRKCVPPMLAGTEQTSKKNKNSGGELGERVGITNK